MGNEISFKDYEQDQGQLFPAHLSEALDPGDPVFFISDLVEGLELEPLEGRYAPMGEHVSSQGDEHGRMGEAEEALEEEIAQILAQMDERNEAEDDEHGDDDGSGGLPAELQDRQTRVAKLRAVREQLAAERGSELKASSQKSFADPDANMMMTGEGSLQYCYNAQAATSEDGVIVATGVTESPLDVQQLVPMVEAIQATTRRKPRVVLADAGYLSEQNLKRLREKRQRCLVAVRGRKRPKWPRGSHTQRMHRVLRLPWAQQLYLHRKTQGERPFAEIKQTMRFRRFSLRGRANIWGEWNLVCAAANALTIYRAGIA